ncbi:hypothetical protein BACCIP111899_02542 [Bacillus rhizoplanae]|uniref:Uncharacterized protein n=1 Tax=Bacillus rhizoplanae TaxID=2880966 RepID=A0ABM8YC28_9BACI|nr:hypothetical protein BACCIP111899_02542 [Bacillus rhizoplanae]
MTFPILETDRCIFKIKFNQKRSETPYSTAQKRIHFEKNFDQNGFLSF